MKNKKSLLLALSLAVFGTVVALKDTFVQTEESQAADVLTISEASITGGVLTVKYVVAQTLSLGGSLNLTVPITMGQISSGNSVTCDTGFTYEKNPTGQFPGGPAANTFSVDSMYTSIAPGTYTCTFSGLSIDIYSETSVTITPYTAKRAIGNAATPPPQSTALISVSVTLNDSAASATSKATVKFSGSGGLINGQKLRFTFPSGFTIPTSSSTLAPACSGGGSLGFGGVIGKVITLQKTGTPVIAAFTLTCSFSGLTNPSSEGSSGAFSFEITDSTGVSVLENGTYAGVTITAKAGQQQTQQQTQQTEQQTQQQAAQTESAQKTEGLSDIDKALAVAKAKLEAKKEETRKQEELDKLKKLAELQAALSAEEEQAATHAAPETKKELKKTVKKQEEEQVEEDEEEELEVSLVDDLLDPELFEVVYQELSVKELKTEKRKLQSAKKDLLKAFKEEQLTATSDKAKKELQKQLKEGLNKIKKATKDLDKETKKKKKEEKATKKKKTKK